jgi:hypothetical protein
MESAKYVDSFIKIVRIAVFFTLSIGRYSRNEKT